MNPILKVILDALVQYLKEHPDQVKKLIELLVDEIIKALEKP